WNDLTTHFQEMQNFNLKKAFFNEDRKKDFSFSLNDCTIDYSKNLINKQTIDLLVNLANEVDLKDAIEQQFDGAIINETEQRAVLHTALRDFTKTPIFVDNKNVKLEIKASLAKIKDFSEAVISRKLKGYTNKAFTDVVNIGIGGSDLGPKMVVESLQFYKNHLNTHFISNIDGDHVQEKIKHLNPETTLFVIVSKTFTTQETISNATFIKDWFLSNGANQKDVKHNFVAVSTNLEKVKAFGIDTNNIFTMWNWVGGRFSLWSAVGLSIALSVGYTNFTELLIGANQMDVHFRNTSFHKNLPVLAALLSIWYNNFYKTQSEAVLPYSQYLESLPSFLQQLSMESNGKSIDRNGKKVTYQTGNIIWGSTGTNMQHAFMQLIHQGTKLIPVDFIGFDNSLYGNTDHHKKLMANFYAQAEALAFGKSREDVHLDLKTNGQITSIEKLLPFKVFEGNRPSTSITFNTLNPKNLGMLIAFYEQKTFVQGVIWNIFSFDQFGVELGKELANKLLKQ
ncbi:MAG TPA: glucose-6-phosphate isomerase, partial [Saprospiraceae bacterium]|nr:glucose-6-phosphate isomerase [Saprospiraceae bacterium]